MFFETDLKKVLEEVKIEEEKQKLILKKLKEKKRKRKDNKDQKIAKIRGKIINKYYDEYKKFLEKNKLVQKRNSRADRKILRGIIFQLMLEVNETAKKHIKKGNIFNIEDLIKSYLEKSVSDKDIIQHFSAHTKEFKDLLEKYFKYRNAINQAVQADIRNDVLTILHNHFDLVMNYEETDPKELRSFEEYIFKKQIGKSLTKLFSHIVDKRDLKPTEICVLMMLYSNVKDDGTAILPQEYVAEKLKLSRDTVGKTIKSLKNKGYIKEIKEHNYKKRLGKIYRINLEKLK